MASAGPVSSWETRLGAPVAPGRPNRYVKAFEQGKDTKGWDQGKDAKEPDDSDERAERRAIL